MIAPARIAAYDVLRRVSTGRADLASASADVRDRLADERDRALATDVAAGTLRWRAALDFLIAHAARRDLAKLDPEVVEILRLSLYQLLHLTRVPAAAVVDDAVSLTRRAGKKSAAGFVNAVLRQLSRNRNALPLPPRPADPSDRQAALAFLSVTHSHPAWLVERWLDRIGFERAAAWTAFNNEPSPLTLRANRLRTTREALLSALGAHGADLRAGAYAPDAIVVSRGTLRDAGDFAGQFVVQDEASQIVALLAGASPGARVLDTCASPGGKATAIAASISGTGMVVACDVRDRRMAILRRTVDAAGTTNVRLVQADASGALPFGASFSTVIVDAPCSGLGTLRRDPDIRWRREPGSLAGFADVQRTILDRAAAVVAPGGRLVYATCSSEPEENEDVARAFLDTHAGFRPLSAGAAHPAIAPDLVDASGHLRTEPDRHGLELFYGAVFERDRQL